MTAPPPVASLPFPSPETLSEAVDAHLEVIEEVRTLRVTTQQLGSDLILLRAESANSLAAALRALDAATVASGKVDLIGKKLSEMHLDVKKLIARLSNGHG